MIAFEPMQVPPPEKSITDRVVETLEEFVRSECRRQRKELLSEYGNYLRGGYGLPWVFLVEAKDGHAEPR